MNRFPIDLSPIRSRHRIAGLLVCLAIAAGCGDDDPGPTDPLPADPVQLVPGTTVGREMFPPGNTAQGGQGQPISGLECIESVDYHAHAHVSLFVEGEQIALPAAIGIVNPGFDDGSAVSGDCFYWLHTHDATGIIHVEPPTIDDTVTLGQLFDLWGQPLETRNVAGFEGTVSVFVDGTRYSGDVRSIPFSQHKHISLQVGTPLAPPPTYIFPQGY